jgi:phosphatidate cytidylyltransferase
LFGHHKVCPSISPGKSWEGLAGSFVGVCVAHVWILPHLEASFAQTVSSNWLLVLGLSAALTGVAFLGGVFLSILKRAKNVKDAGDVLPGHGGFLDRFDSVFAVVLAVWVLLLCPVLFSTLRATQVSDQVTSAVVK